MNVHRVAWLGTTLFDHTPQLRFFCGWQDAQAFVNRLEQPVWWVADEVILEAAERMWPPAIGDYPDDGGSWPWERLKLDDFNTSAP